MTQDQQKLIDALVIKGLDGDMDSVNAEEDRVIRAKVKAMIVKINKGLAERPEIPEIKDEFVQQDVAGEIEQLSKEEMISYLANKGLDGDMDAVNAQEDRVIRAKVKALIVKINKGLAERPKMPALLSKSDQPNNDPHVEEKSVKTKNSNACQLVKDLLREKYPDALQENEKIDYIQIKPDQWYEIATWLKSEDGLFFDSLQCQMGIDIGDGMLESRYNLHSMRQDHYLELRIAVSSDSAKIPSVEKIWRIADWFERETYDMYGIEFVGHRDLRRILLPDDWEGWPLRKDYVVQETYHGIVVPKLKEGWE